ncbi:MAG TPA: DUF2339 domain-containing protein [Polyangiaceae bacterium]|nr:DUF2339 domain-containing protein [Polyangiaceae bacterium]
MDEVLAVIAVLAAGAFLLAPLVALVLVFQVRKRNAQLARQVEELQQRGARTDWWIGELARRMGETQRGSVDDEPARSATETAPRADASASMNADANAGVNASAPADTPTSGGVRTAGAGRAIFGRNPEEVGADADVATALGDAGGPRRAPASRAFDFEKLVGVRLFAWLGGLGLFIGAAFFLEYSIEHDLISPPLRIGIGLLSGAVAVLVGDIIRSKADRAGQALGGAGIATLYASLFAARTLYELIPAPATFVAMALVTALAGFSAVRRDAFVLAVIGLVGGFATPVLLSSGVDHRYALFGYIGLLDAGVLFVSAKRQWMTLTALAFIATALIYGGWASEYLDQSGVPFALSVAAALAALFALGTLNRAAAPPRTTPLRTGLFATALAAPFIAALAVGSQSDLRASAAFLSGYLCLLLAGTFVLAERWGAPLSLEIGAGLTVLTLSGRVAPDVVGDERLRTLFAFTGPPFLLLALWFWQERRASERMAASLRRAAGIALGGSWIVVGQMLSEEAAAAPLAPLGLYAAAHVVGFVAIGLTVPSPRWLAFAHALWIATLLTLTQHDGPLRLNEFLPFILVPMLGFFALPLVTSRAHSEPIGWITAALSLVTHYATLYLLARNVWLDIALGAGALVAGALALGMLSFARPRVVGAGPSGVIATLGAVTLAFLTAAVPITLSKQWITVAWGLEAAALAWLYLRIAHKGLLVASALLALSTLVRLVANPSLWEYHPRSGIIVFNWYLYTFGLPALAFFATAYLLRGDAAAKQYRYPAALWFVGGAVVFVLLNVEIADAYSTGQTIGFHMGASLGEDMTYSLGWGVFGLSTLVVGMVVRSTRARISALAVLLLTIAKVFLHDLWHLGALYRVGSMVGLAMALLAVSFLTQRFILRGDRS